MTGEQAGWMWRTGELDRPESERLYTLASDDDAPLDFDSWVVHWGRCFLGLADGRS